MNAAASTIDQINAHLAAASAALQAATLALETRPRCKKCGKAPVARYGEMPVACAGDMCVVCCHEYIAKGGK